MPRRRPRHRPVPQRRDTQRVRRSADQNGGGPARFAGIEPRGSFGARSILADRAGPPMEEACPRRSPCSVDAVPRRPGFARQQGREVTTAAVRAKKPPGRRTGCGFHRAPRGAVGPVFQGGAARAARDRDRSSHRRGGRGPGQRFRPGRHPHRRGRADAPGSDGARRSRAALPRSRGPRPPQGVAGTPDTGAPASRLAECRRQRRAVIHAAHGLASGQTHGNTDGNVPAFTPDRPTGADHNDRREAREGAA